MILGGCWRLARRLKRGSGGQQPPQDTYIYIYIHVYMYICTSHSNTELLEHYDTYHDRQSANEIPRDTHKYIYIYIYICGSPPGMCKNTWVFGYSGPCKAQNTIIYIVLGLARPRILLFIGFWALQGPEYYYL